MSGLITADSSRKPSGSSTHSVGHSPSGSPSKMHFQRNLSPNNSNMFGVGMGSANSLKGLNSGWQVWGSGQPSSKRNASISSATSGVEHSPSQAGDPNHRGNLGEGWTASRPTSGNWDEPNGSPQKKDFSLEAQSSLALQQTRHRPSNSAQPARLTIPRIDDRSAGPKNAQLSPQRYDNGMIADAPNSSRYPAVSPTKSNYTNSFNPQQVHANHIYNGTHPSSTADNELSSALRGMVVEDDYSLSRSQINSSQNNTALVNNTPLRAAPPVPRPPYNQYPHPDFSAYYPNQPVAREPYIDFPYGYDAYRNPSNPSMYPSSALLGGNSSAPIYPGQSAQNMHANVLDMHRQQSGYYFDYNAASRGGSQYFYPTGMMYAPPTHSPIATPQMAPANASPLNKKQYDMHRQLAPQNLMYASVRSPPSPHSQAYGTAMDYGSHLNPILQGGSMYAQGMNPLAIHAYQQGLRPPQIPDTREPVALRSALLEEFRSNKARKWELKDVLGFVVEFSGDQHGSRFIQQKLETATTEEKQTVFDEIVPNSALQLIQDVFGNYVVQKLFEHGTQVQKTILANTMEGHILPLSLQMYGCRVVQKAIEYILPDQQAALVRELDPHVLKCVKDANGNHVIQKLIERVSPDRLGFVNTFRGNVFELATHPYGCRVLQRCFEHLPEEYMRPLLDELHKYSANLMQDQFGNYVVQFVLEHGKPQDRVLVISKLRGQILQMARHKFASNVCEKALVCADLESRRVLIDEIMTPKQDGVSPIVTMMKDQFANYVLQRALNVADKDQKEALILKIRPHVVSMRRYSSAYSKHLISIERLLERYASLMPTNPEPAQTSQHY